LDGLAGVVWRRGGRSGRGFCPGRGRLAGWRRKGWLGVNFRRRGFSGGGPEASFVSDDGEDCADGGRLVFLDEDLEEDAADGRRHLGVNLVGGHLEEGFVGCDLVANLLEPT
jgi:hypothetical protein